MTTTVAAMISGAPRTVLYCAPNIRKCWEKRGYDVTYFLVLWNDDLTLEMETEIVNAFPKCHFAFVPNRGFVEEGNRVLHLPTDMYDFRNIFRQFYGIRLANNMRRKHERESKTKFDIVARMRPDEVYQKHIGITLQDIKKKTIILPNHSHCSGLNDHFACGDSASMTVYAKHYDWLLEKLHNLHINNPMPPSKGPRLRKNRNLLPYLTPEYLLERYLRIDTSLKIVEYPVMYKTIRSIHVGMDFDDVPQMSCNARDINKWL